ncbi:hypothetical protein ATANTOWER_020208 [Ataeniobius toweri]|uniref:Ribosomal protein L16 n=1 Tax=Ataeniobius toweri TaxID=208326 RepID=A0ABU7CLL8_9TELE|nr:hypothetical protein [Ataeniobius toweri]
MGGKRGKTYRKCLSGSGYLRLGLRPPYMARMLYRCATSTPWFLVLIKYIKKSFSDIKKSVTRLSDIGD